MALMVEEGGQKQASLEAGQGKAAGSSGASRKGHSSANTSILAQ